MAWFTPTLTLCKTRLAGAEWTSLSSAARGQGQDAEAMAQEVIATQVTRIRGRVAANSKNILGEAGTIPDELQGAFLALWVYEFITRLPAMKALLDELRVKSYDTALSELAAAARGDIAIVPPETAAPEAAQAGGVSVEVVRARENVAAPCHMDGLL
ncbi:MAG: hypothetical protein ACO1TE_29150 [Prosthecobacter sp.]